MHWMCFGMTIVLFVRSNQISDSLVASHMVSKADNTFNDAFVHYERLLYPHENHVFFYILYMV